MKLNFLKVLAMALLLAGGFSCQTSEETVDPPEEVSDCEPITTDDDGIVFEPIIPGDEEIVYEPIIPCSKVTAFFEENLSPNSGSIPYGCFFVGTGTSENLCAIINSVDEFREISSCPAIMLPEIDFRLYMLVIGKYYPMSTAGHKVLGQNLIAGSEKFELNLIVSKEGGAFGALSDLRHWGIYPKIKSDIPVSVTYK